MPFVYIAEPKKKRDTFRGTSKKVYLWQTIAPPMHIETIAFHIQAYPSGGSQTVTRHLARFFRSRSYRVVLYTPVLDDKRLTDEDRRLFDFRILPCLTTGHPDNAAFLCRSLPEERVSHLVVQHDPGFPFAAVRERTTVRIVFCMHSLPLWEREMLRSRSCAELSHPTLARKLELLFLRKPVYYLTPKLRRRYLRLYAGILPHIDRFVTLCPQYRDRMRQLVCDSGYPGSDVPVEKFAAILNPLPPVHDDRSVPKERVVLYVGRLRNSVKRVDRLLKIWQRIVLKHPGWRLVVVGTGIAEERLRRMAARRERDGEQTIEFTGYHQDVSPFYRRARFVCLTSNYEGFPMCLMEGQQYGAIPVAFDSFEGLREITCKGRCGIEVPAYDLGKYVRLLGDALDDEELQQRMSDRCREAARRYDPELIGEEWLRLFEAL